MPDKHGFTMNNDPAWVREKAAKEDGCFISVGGDADTNAVRAWLRGEIDCPLAEDLNNLCDELDARRKPVEREPERPDYERFKHLAIPRAFTNDQFSKAEYHQILSRALWLESQLAAEREKVRELEQRNAEYARALED